jgi:hypothetical protein
MQAADQGLSWEEIDEQALRATQNYRSNLHDIPEDTQIEYGSQPSTDPSDDSSSDDETPEPNPRAPPRPSNKRQGPIGAKHPRPFNGDRSQAEHFINEVKAYLRLNQGTALEQSPRRKVEFALTFMQGPEVVTWAATIGNWLDTLGDHENIPAVWEAFLDQFFYRFQDTTAQEDARQALTKIRITWPDIDQYVADFEELVSEGRIRP